MEHSALVAAFAQAPVAMAVLEAHEPFRVVMANAAFAREVADAPVDTLNGLALEAATRRPRLAHDLADALRRVAADGELRVVVQQQALRRRHWEVTISRIAHLGAPALLYVGSDVTAREQQRRRLNEATQRLTTLTCFARESLSFDSERQQNAVVDAASAICHGPAAIYLGAPDASLRRAALRGVAVEQARVLPEFLAAERFQAVRTALADGMSRVITYVTSESYGDDDQQVALRQLGAQWLTVVPVRAGLEPIGVLLTFWRGPVSGPSPEHLQVLEACAAQLALASEHARLYHAVEQERAELALVLEQIPDAVVIADELGRVANANPTARRLLGAAPGVTLPANAMPMNGGGIHDLGLGRALTGETVRGTLGMVRGPSAEPTWIISSAAPLQTSSGALMGAVAVATDITEHRRAEESLRVAAETSAALAGSLDYRGTLPTVARLLVPRVADVCAIDIIEAGGLARLAVACAEPISPEATQGLRRCPMPIPAAQDGALAAVPPCLFTEVDAEALRALACDPQHLALLRSLALRSSLTVPIAARGRTYGMLWLATAHSGRRYAREMLVLAEDVARRIATAIDNARLFNDAQDANRRKDEFLAILSHELRTPLAPIMAWAQVLKRTADPERVRLAIEVIERNVRLQTALIDDLLDLTAITRGKVTLDVAVHDLRAIVDAATETVRPKVLDKSLALACEVPAEEVLIEGDANRLQQVVWNLLANAIKFSPASGRVAVSVVRENDQAVIRVRDQGAGIDPEFLPHVFDMFRQQEAGSRRTYGGLGIGLAIAQRVTELHRGTIEVYSDGVGKGAEFCVRLPRVAAAGFSANGAVTATPLRAHAVLLVEDVPDMREAARLVLEQMGVRVIEAAEGREALARLDEGHIDLMLCDLRMPIMDGFELIRRVREDPRYHTLPVIAVSGYATLDDEQRTRDAGFDGYIRKPFVEDTLSATVERVLRERGRTVSPERADAAG